MNLYEMFQNILLYWIKFSVLERLIVHKLRWMNVRL